jgi:hypothetical protein
MPTDTPKGFVPDEQQLPEGFVPDNKAAPAVPGAPEGLPNPATPILSNIIPEGEAATRLQGTAMVSPNPSTGAAEEQERRLNEYNPGGQLLNATIAPQAFHAPLQTIRALAGSQIGSRVARGGTELMGGGETAQDIASVAGGLVGGAGGAELPAVGRGIRAVARGALLDPVTGEPTVSPTSITRRILRTPEEAESSVLAKAKAEAVPMRESPNYGLFKAASAPAAAPEVMPMTASPNYFEYKQALARGGRPQPELGSPENPGFMAKLPVRMPKPEVTPLSESPYAIQHQQATAADLEARRPIPLSQSPYYEQNRSAMAADAEARKPIPLSQSPYATQHAEELEARKPMPLSQSPNLVRYQAAEQDLKPVPISQSPYANRNESIASFARGEPGPNTPLSQSPVPRPKPTQSIRSIATQRAIPKEGRPATWTNEKVKELASWGDPDGIAQAEARGFGRIPLKYSEAELNPRSVTRFTSEGVPIKEGLPQGNPTPFGKSIRETAAPALRPEVEGLVRSRAMEIPEWKAQEQSYELQKARDILRNANATDEDKAVSQARIEESQ